MPADRLHPLSPPPVSSIDDRVTLAVQKAGL